MTDEPARGAGLLTTDDTLIDRVVAGKFALRRLIGAGASGAVYQADQIALGRTVAVKLLRPELTRDPRFVRRFHDEALAASRLNHPNVVSVIDYGQTEDGLLYLVMEYLRGTTLTEVLHGEPLPTARIVDLVSQILNGLEEAHDAGVIHADLKSDNVVVEHRRNDWDLVKVVDFGIARLVGRSGSSEGETICGTPEYMAPEIISGGVTSPASDLYAVGVVVYELLTGVTPFVGGTSMDVLRRHLSVAPVRPSARRPELIIDPSLDEITLIALAKDPARRFASAADFRSALLRIQRARTEPSSRERAVCGGCGVLSPVTFKFCPECGAPRQEAEPAAAGAAPHEVFALRRSDRVGTSEVPVTSRDRTSESFETVVEPPHGGLLPLPFYGRHAELDRLRSFLAERAPSPALLLRGPVGSGRSRLVREALAALGADRHTVVQSGDDPTGLGRTYHPIRVVLSALLGIPQDDRSVDLRRRLSDAGLAARDLPGLLELLGREGPLWQLEAQVRTREVGAALIRAFHAAAARGPTVVVFDDFDRFDLPSQEVARRLVEASAIENLRIVVVTGAEAGPPWTRALPPLELGPLSDEALVKLADFLASTGNPSVPALADLRARSGGSPGQIRQLVRYIIEGGAIAAAPLGLADLIAARLDLLPRTARLACQAVAVLGTQASLAHVQRLLGDVGDVAEALSILEARGLVGREGETLRFDGQLIRDVTYDAIPADVRRALHRHAADLLVASGDAALLGSHLLVSGDLERAVALLTHAGDDAAHDQDDGAARRFYTDALGAARMLMLQDAAPSARGHYGAISVKLADVLTSAGEVALARGVLEEARYHCADARGIAAQLSRASAHVHAAAGDEAQATAALRDGILHAIMSGQRELLCELYLDLATQCVRAGEIDLARSELAEAIDLVTMGEGGAARSGPTPLWRLCFRLAQLHAAGGDRGQAVSRAEEAIRHAERVNSRAGVARVQTMLASLFDRSGEVDKANYYRGLAVEAMRRLGDRRATAELLLVGSRLTQAMPRIKPESLREAELLASEVGWSEGVSRARRAGSLSPPQDIDI